MTQGRCQDLTLDFKVMASGSYPRMWLAPLVHPHSLSGTCKNDSMLTTVLWFSYLVPIGRSQSDGLVYLVNPRFDVQGRWRRRRDWPAELR